MDSIGWGLQMTLLGMAAVFALLIVMMALLYGISWLDRRKTVQADQAVAALTAETAPAAIEPVPVPGGLSADQIAAITVAVMTHARVRRLQATPEARVHEPGSHLYASRWVTVGRAYQQQPWTRR